MKHRAQTHARTKTIPLVFAALAVAASGMALTVSSAPSAIATAAAENARALPTASDPNLIRHVQYSGLSGAKTGKAPVTLAQVQEDVATLSRTADIISATEVKTSGRAKAMTQPGWARCWNKGDTGVFVRSSEWTITACEDRQVAPGHRYWVNVSGEWRDVTPITLALVTHKVTGKKVVVSVGHALSCVEARDGKGWIANNENCATGKKIANTVVTNRQKVRVPAFRAQVDGWMRATASFRRDHGAHGVIVTGDFNLDWKKSWVREYLKPKVALSGANISGWKSWQASTRTHTLRIPGKAPRARIIDLTFVGGTGVGITQPTFAYAERVSSDHHATGTVIRLPE